MRIENWILKGAKELEGLVLPEEFNKSTILLVGNIYGRENFPDGSLVSTSPIVNITDTHATTRSGKVYKLGKKHPDYEKFLNAVKNNIPVMKEWRITVDTTPKLLFGIKMGVEDNIFDKFILGSVTSYNTEENIYIINDEIKVFIDWLSINFEQNVEMALFWNDEKREKLLNFAHKFIKLDFDSIHKKLFE